jgi:hypothetical protein
LGGHRAHGVAMLNGIAQPSTDGLKQSLTSTRLGGIKLEPQFNFFVAALVVQRSFYKRQSFNRTFAVQVKNLRDVQIFG